MEHKYKIRIRLLSIISIILLCIGSVVKWLQNDTFYIIKLGSDILENGVDLVDHYCWITNLSYTYPHWLYNVFLYLIYDNFSYYGVYVSTILLFIILILVIYIIQLKINKNDFLAFLVAVTSIVCLSGFATARSQLITIILYILEVYFIEKLIKNGGKRYIIYLSLISLIIANVHATIWMFTFVLYLPFIVSYLVYRISKKIKLESFRKKIIIEDIKNIKLVIISMIISFIMGLFSPSRICYTYIFKIMMGISQEYILEHVPMVIIEQPFFIAFCLILLLILLFSNEKIYLKELFMICGLMLMSLVSIRHLMFFYTISILYISVIVMRYLRNKNDNSLDILGLLLVKKRVIYIFIYILVISIFIYKYDKVSDGVYVPRSDYPIGVVEFINDNLDKKSLRLYNGYNYGSYLLFNDIPVFIDSRCDLYLPEFNGLEFNIFEDAMNIVDNYEDSFDFYGVSYVVLKKEEVLYKILDKDINYKELYEDEYFVLFERINYEEAGS